MEEQYELINKFVEEIQHKNRFFVSKEITDKFDVIISDFRHIIKAGSKLYRGRVLPRGRKAPYGVDEHGIPPKDRFSNGRANPYGINYLYLCKNIDTVVAELRPNMDSLISIGTFTVLDDIDTVKLTNNAVHDSQEYATMRVLLSMILSRPVQPDRSELEYLPMQYFSEYCKQKNADGIMFLSSVMRNYERENFNVTLFEESKVKCIETSVVRVNNIKYEYSRLTDTE